MANKIATPARVRLDLTHDDRARLRKAAGQANQSMAEFARNAVLAAIEKRLGKSNG
jgi:uncharacterized protein (DUF1778 family)